MFDFFNVFYYTIFINKKGDEIVKKIKLKRLKLKSVYTRYMLIFMAIMFFTVAILGVLVTTIAGNYATETKRNELYETNVLFKKTVLSMSGEYESIEKQLKSNETALRENLSFAFFAMSDCGVIITDNQGKIAFFAYRDAQSGEPILLYGDGALSKNEVINKLQINKNILLDIYESRNVFRDSDMGDLFTKSVDFLCIRNF